MGKRATEKGYLLLTALAEAPNHGYALGQRVEEMTHGNVKIAVGTLYATLDRLLSDGLIEDAGTETVDGRARHLYQISGRGRVELAAQATHVERVSAAMHAALRLGST